jgi:Holliday junction resolvase
LKRSRTDRNQQDVIDALRKAGCSVLSLANVGQGCPDLLCGLAGKNWLIEVKDGTKPPSRQKLTPAQERFHEFHVEHPEKYWNGQKAVVTTVHEALAVVIGVE